MPDIAVCKVEVELLVSTIDTTLEMLATLAEEEDDDSFLVPRTYLDRSRDYFRGVLDYPKFVIAPLPRPKPKPSRDFGLVAIPIHQLTSEAIQNLGLDLHPQLVENLQISVLERGRSRFVVVSADGLSPDEIETMRDVVGEHFGLPTVATNYPIRVELYEVERRIGRYEAIIEDDEPPQRAFRFQTRARRNRRAKVHFCRWGS